MRDTSALLRTKPTPPSMCYASSYDDRLRNPDGVLTPVPELLEELNFRLLTCQYYRVVHVRNPSGDVSTCAH